MNRCFNVSNVITLLLIACSACSSEDAGRQGQGNGEHASEEALFSDAEFIEKARGFFVAVYGKEPRKSSED